MRTIYSNYQATIYSVVPVVHVLVLPHNGADSPGLQLQELRFSCVTAALG